MTSLNLDIVCDENTHISKSYILKNIHEREFSVFKTNWRTELDKTDRPNGSKSKLRSYKSFKITFDTESYIFNDIPRSHRSALAKFRCGVAPIKLETGRYENVPLGERKCFICDAVESECHVICECPLYEDLRNALFAKAENVVPNFYALSNFEKNVYIALTL